MITEDLDLIEEAEEIAREAAREIEEAAIEAAEMAEARATRDGAKAVAQMIRTRKLATVADVIAALEGNQEPGWIDVWCDLTMECKGQYAGTEPASEVLLDIAENYS